MRNKSRTIKIKAGLFALVCLSFFFSCEEEKANVKIKLSYSERRVVDTLYNEVVQQLSADMDSLCELNFEKNVQIMIDSILQMRRLDEERLRRKIPIKER